MNESKLRQFLSDRTGQIVLTIGIYIISLLLISILGAMSGAIEGALGDAMGIVSLIVFIVWTIAGWRSLTVIQPSVFLIMPIAGWIAYFVIKGILSLIVGIFVLPYQISKFVINRVNGTQ